MPTNKKCISIGIKTAYSPTCTTACPTVPLSIHTTGCRPPWPVARGHWALYSDAADASKAQRIHTHTQKTIIKRFVCLHRRRNIDNSNKRKRESGTEGRGGQMRIDRAADEPLMTVITITIMIILQ